MPDRRQFGAPNSGLMILYYENRSKRVKQVKQDKQGICIRLEITWEDIECLRIVTWTLVLEPTTNSYRTFLPRSFRQYYSGIVGVAL